MQYDYIASKYALQGKWRNANGAMGNSMELLHEPVAGPSAWTGRQMRADLRWIVDWTPQAIAEIEAAADTLRQHGKVAPYFSRADFPLPATAGFLADAIREVSSGRGFVLLRGLPVGRWSEQTLRNVYWGLGLHWGSAVTQNRQGDAIAEIIDRGLDANEVGVKPSMTNAEQRPH